MQTFDRKKNEAIMTGVWKIEDDYECVSMCGRS